MTYTTLESIDPFYAACLKLPASPQRRSSRTSRSTPGCRAPRSPAARCRT